MLLSPSEEAITDWFIPVNTYCNDRVRVERLWDRGKGLKVQKRTFPLLKNM